MAINLVKVLSGSSLTETVLVFKPVDFLVAVITVTVTGSPAVQVTFTSGNILVAEVADSKASLAKLYTDLDAYYNQ